MGLREARDLAEVVELVRTVPDLYVRYSYGPERDAEEPRSHDYEAKVDLPGLSVAAIVPEEWWPRTVEDWVARRICSYAHLGEEEGRFAYLLTGRLVGRGPDHEPIIADMQPVARISDHAVQEARAHYEERFDVGQDSRG
jgi:hypothetical protein